MIATALPQLTAASWQTPHGMIHASVRELDHRRSDGIDVTLRWDPLTNELSVVVRDERLGESLAFEVYAADALRAFHHPYAYAANLPVAPKPEQPAALYLGRVGSWAKLRDNAGHPLCPYDATSARSDWSPAMRGQQGPTAARQQS